MSSNFLAAQPTAAFVGRARPCEGNARSLPSQLMENNGYQRATDRLRVGGARVMCPNRNVGISVGVMLERAYYYLARATTFASGE